MARPATKEKELGIIGILREVLAIPLRNPGLVAYVLLLLLPCNFLLTFPKLSPRLGALNVAPLVNRLLRRMQERSLGESPGVAEVPWFDKLPRDAIPLDYVVAELTELAMVYLSVVACSGKHAALGVLQSKVRRSWKKVAISSLYLQLFHFTDACLFRLVAALMAAFDLPRWLFLLLPLAFFSMVLSRLVFFVYLDIVCRLCLVVSAVEEDKGGVAALAKAFGLTRRRKLQGIVLKLLCVALSQLAPRNYPMVGGEKQTGEIASLVVAWRFGGVLVDLSRRLLDWLLWTVYYYECRKSQGLTGKEDMGDEGRSLLPSPCSSSVVNDELI